MRRGDELIAFYRDWLNEVAKDGEETLEKPVSRKQHTDNIIQISAIATDAKDYACIGLVLGVINIVGLIALAIVSFIL